MAAGVPGDGGGIVGLVRLATGPRRRALDFDLLRWAGGTSADIPGRVSWDAALAVVGNLPPDSALMREQDPETWVWSTQAKTNGLLADLYDLLAWVNYNVVASATRKGMRRPRKPKPYPRPGSKAKGTTIGRDPIPAKDFDRWWSGGDR